MLVRLSQEQLGNLMNLLDRVSVKGFKEIQAITEIVTAIQNPIQEDDTAKKSENSGK